MTQHVLRELGLTARRVGDEYHGRASVIPAMQVPGTSQLRTSVLATWADMLTGLLAVDATAPGFPLTQDLGMELCRPAPGSGAVEAVARTVKHGRSVFVAGVEITAGDGRLIAFGTSSFLPSPGPTTRAPEKLSVGSEPAERLLSRPLAERVGCERKAPGVAFLPRSEDGVNGAGAINGGLVALVVEEAALSLAPGASLRSISLRYLRPVLVGPAVATAVARGGGVGQVEVRDAGAGNRLAALSTIRMSA